MNIVRTSDGVPVNLDFISKVLWAGTFAGAKNVPNRVVWFHAITGSKAGGTNSGSTYAETKLTPLEGYAMFLRVSQLVLDIQTGKNVSRDLSLNPTSIKSTSLAGDTYTHGADQLVSIYGGKFYRLNPVVTIGILGIATATPVAYAYVPTEIYNATFISENEVQFTIPSTVGAGTYRVCYTDGIGNSADYESIILT